MPLWKNKVQVNNTYYTVVMSVQTSLRLDGGTGKLSININKTNILIKHILTDMDKEISGLFSGWLIVVRLPETDETLAIKNALQTADTILTSFCFDSIRDVHPLTIHLVYDSSDNKKSRHFTQWIHKLPYGDTDIDVSLYNHHAKCIYQLQHQDRERIYRALRWFRKGMISNDYLDQFVFFWLGLEALNTPLAKEFGCEKDALKEMSYKCNNCGIESSYTKETKMGIDKLFDKLNVTTQTRKDISDIRNGILHGYKNIDDNLIQIIKKINPQIAYFLHVGLEIVLKMPYDRAKDGRFNSVSPVKIHDFLIFEMNLLEPDRNKLGVNGEHPYFIFKPVNFHFTLDGVNFDMKAIKKISCKHDEICHFKIPGQHSKIDVQVKSMTEK